MDVIQFTGLYIDAANGLAISDKVLSFMCGLTVLRNLLILLKKKSFFFTTSHLNQNIHVILLSEIIERKIPDPG